MFKVNIIESERGWGRKVEETKEFPTEKQAKDFIEEYNKDNTNLSVPDWYMVAELVPGGTEDSGAKLLIKVITLLQSNHREAYREVIGRFPELKGCV